MLFIIKINFTPKIFIPLQKVPLPKYPGLQAHLNEPMVLVQTALLWQLSFPSVHSSISKDREVNIKNHVFFLPLAIMLLISIRIS